MTQAPTPARMAAHVLRAVALILAVLGALAAALVWWKLDAEPFAALPALIVGWPWTQAFAPLNAAMQLELSPLRGKLLLTALLMLNPLLLWGLSRLLARRR